MFTSSHPIRKRPRNESYFHNPLHRRDWRRDDVSPNLREVGTVTNIDRDDALGVFVGNIYQHHIPRMSLNKRCDVAVLRPADQVAFPVSRNSTVFDAGGVITTAFPGAIVQTCIVHLVRHSLNFCSWKDRKAVATDLRRIYGAATADQAVAELDAFEDKWAGKYASIAPAWRRAWHEVIPFFAFDPAIRKIIYSTNAIESLNRVIQKSIKPRGSFPTEEAATKLIYLAIRSFEKGGRNVREWYAARNQFAIMFEERFNA
jgi:hypothetical protein